MESRPGAIEEEFISYSPMSDIAPEAADDMSIYEILPFEKTMSESEKDSEDGISAGNSVGDVGKPAGNNIENNRSDTTSTASGTGGNPINISVEEGKGKPKATNAVRTLPTAGASTSKAKTPLDSESTFSQDDFERLEKLRNIPLERLTGRQQDELHQVFYKKHAERDIRYMNTRWERPIHMYFESLTNVEEATQSSLDVLARTAISKPMENSFAVCTSVALTGLSVSVAGKVKILFEWDWCFCLR